MGGMGEKKNDNLTHKQSQHLPLTQSVSSSLVVVMGVLRPLSIGPVPVPVPVSEPVDVPTPLPTPSSVLILIPEPLSAAAIPVEEEDVPGLLLSPAAEVLESILVRFEFDAEPVMELVEEEDSAAGGWEEGGGNKKSPALFELELSLLVATDIGVGASEKAPGVAGSASPITDMGVGGSEFSAARLIPDMLWVMVEAEAMEDMEAVEAREEHESERFIFPPAPPPFPFLPPPVVLPFSSPSMSRSFSSDMGFFRMIDLCRMSGWFQIC